MTDAPIAAGLPHERLRSHSEPNLLQRAEVLLRVSDAGGRSITGSGRVRAAAWMARTHLEGTVDTLLLDAGLEAGDATMRVRLACLQVTHPAVAPTVAAAWWGLSRCYHHHAYELTPTTGEVGHLVSLVRRIDTAATQAERPDSSPAPADR